MATKITDQPIKRAFSGTLQALISEATVANGGYVGWPKPLGYNEVLVEVTGGTLGARITFGVPILHAYLFDASLTGAARWIDYGHRFEIGNNDLMDPRGATAKVTPALTTSDYLYLATPEPLSGYHFMVGAAQTEASVAAVDVSTNAGWDSHAAAAVTDTTESPAGDVWGSDGEISLDVLPGQGLAPAWQARKLRDLLGTDLTNGVPDLIRDDIVYWGRISVSATTSAVTFNSIQGCDLLLSHSTTKGDAPSSAAYLDGDLSFTFDCDETVAGVMLCSRDAGTPTISTSWFSKD